MARGARGRSNMAKHRQGRSSGGVAVQSQNTFARLDNAEYDDGEVNAHLNERFSGRHSVSNNLIPNDDVPTSTSSRENNHIREYFDIAKQPVNGGAWLNKLEIPTPSEVLNKKHEFNSTGSARLVEANENIRPHKIKGAYESKEDYLRTKYELFREDAIRPLREAIDVVRADPFKDEIDYGNNNIGIYDPVYITSLVFSPRGLATRIAFSLNRVKKHIRWEQSKRLITGTLVALSPVDDAFQTKCVLATVAARPLSAMEQNPPEIDIFFACPEEQEIDPMRKWIMVECRSSFFEASRHTLLALQHLMREPFPLSKYLVEAEKEVAAPAYVHHNPYMNLSSLVSAEDVLKYENVNTLEEWPSALSQTLDKSQVKALKRMLTKELAVVQGPPGTGKTFVSVVALQIARDNLEKEDAPIIVTAQTNHALDQLLRHTAQFEPNYIRLGGRSKDREIKKRTLFEMRSDLPQQKQPGSQKVQAMIAIKKSTVAAQMMLAPFEANKPPLTHKFLHVMGLITERQVESLESKAPCTLGYSSNDNPNALMIEWLGKCLAPCSRPIQPDNYDWGFEEEDLDVEQLQELEAEAVAKDDDDVEALRGPVASLSDNFMGRGGSWLTTSKIQDILRKTDDMNAIRHEDRGAIYNHLMRETKKLVTIEIRKIAKDYSAAVQQRKVGLWEEDVRILRKARIIGCTTTGLSKYRALLSGLRPRVCLVEEAAETLEAPVTAACFPTLEHLILVGDHQQLRPHTQVKAFENEPFFLNLSLFERLVWNEVEFDTLTSQRRMIPEIRRLLYPIYESTLKDHSSVKLSSNRPPVEGMGGNNSFFFCHEWPEGRDANKSAFNEREASMIVGYFDYLVLNGVDASTITVLTFYNGQRKLILRKLREHQNLRAFAPLVKVVTVDSYQGEENDIVLLSLVRSVTGNQSTSSLVRSAKPHKIGFLSSENRACVALSRAKRGFYIFGNAELLACESGTWAAVIDIMHGNKKSKVTTGQERRIGYHIPLQCEAHGRRIWIEEPEDWQHLHGGCDIRCGATLPCEHRCPYMCHPFEHGSVNCIQKCSRRIKFCGHACNEMCYEACRCRKCEDRPRGGMRPSFAGASSLNTSTNYLYQPSTPSQNINGNMQEAVGTAEEWQAYASGGVSIDDAQVRQLRIEEDAKYVRALQASVGGTSGLASSGVTSRAARIVDATPENKTGSRHANLLVDVGIDGKPPTGRQRYAETLVYKARSEEGPNFSLLD